MSVYKNAVVMYERKDEKICVSINKYSEREITYRIYSAKESKLLSEWLEFSRKHNMYRGKKIDANCQFLKIADVRWEDIILPADVISVVRSHVDELFVYSEYLKANNMTLKRGVILSGEPGTGKTMLCKAMAREIDGTVIYALPSHLERSGDIARVCEMAKDLAPCMLIIEDIDWLAEDREQTYSAGAVIELMNYLDGVQEFKDIVTLATTNNHEKIEKAVANRPGRFDRVIDIPKPDQTCRERMFKKFTEKLKFEGEIDWAKVIRKTDGLSGSHVKDVCKTIVLHAIRSKSTDENKIAIVKQSHFDSALAEVNNEKFSSFKKASGKKSRIGFGADDDS
jgi:ATP-dependent 26S proteasome regulatory subunit